MFSIFWYFSSYLNFVNLCLPLLNWCIYAQILCLFNNYQNSFILALSYKKKSLVIKYVNGIYLIKEHGKAWKEKQQSLPCDQDIGPSAFAIFAIRTCFLSIYLFAD